MGLLEIPQRNEKTAVGIQSAWPLECLKELTVDYEELGVRGSEGCESYYSFP